MKTKLKFILSLIIIIGCNRKKNSANFNDLEVIRVVGAEKEAIPKQGDTLNIFYENSREIKEKKFSNENYFYVLYFDKKGVKEQLRIYPLEALENKTIINYNKEGVVIFIADYTKGIADGNFQKFYENGNVKETGTYYRTVKDKIWKYYNENGLLIKQEWYSRGDLLEEIKFKN